MSVYKRLLKQQKVEYMIIITLVSWYTLYQPIKRLVAYEYRRHAAALTFVPAFLIELWLTQDFFRVMLTKFFA